MNVLRPIYSNSEESSLTTATPVKPQVKPLADRVVLKKVEKEDRTSGGIVIPDSVQERPQQGEVLAVGPGKLDEHGNRQPGELKVGDKVLFAKYSGTEFKLDGVEYLILSEKDILAVLS